MIRLFEVENYKVKVTENCYLIKPFKAILDEHPDPKDHIPMFSYIFFMTCPGNDNPYFNVPEQDREEQVIKDMENPIDTEDDLIIAAIERAEYLFETPTVRAYKGMKQMIDNLATYMSDSEITAGRDGNLSQLVQAAKSLQQIRDSFKGVSKDLAEEQELNVRGDKQLPYDQIK